MDIKDATYYVQKEKFLSDMRLYMQYLIKGIGFCFAQIPSNDKTAILLEQLKEYGFVSMDTTIEHFRVIFGIPLHKNNTPFKPIKWKKNRQLLRYFVYTLFPKETMWGTGQFAIPHLFANKHGEPIKVIPQSDKKRLEYSSDYENLKDLLKKFNE